MRTQIIISEGMEIERNGQSEINKIINPISVIRVPFIPAGLNFTITILTSGIDYDNIHKFTISVENPRSNGNDKLLFTTGEQILQKMPGSTDNFNFNVDVRNVPIRTQGTYVVNFEFDEKVINQEFEVVGDEVFS